MKSLPVVMASYAAYHRHPLNKALHFLGVPLITFALLLSLSWLRVELFGLSVTAAIPFVLVVLGYYVRLDPVLAVSLSVVLVPVVYQADLVARGSWGQNLAVFALTFVGGWIIQLAGHAVEGRRPALVDNIFQVFAAPLFLMAELFFLLGLKQDLKRQVEDLVRGEV